MAKKTYHFDSHKINYIYFRFPKESAIQPYFKTDVSKKFTSQDEELYYVVKKAALEALDVDGDHKGFGTWGKERKSIIAALTPKLFPIYEFLRVSKEEIKISYTSNSGKIIVCTPGDIIVDLLDIRMNGELIKIPNYFGRDIPTSRKVRISD